jgi:hypothetical protein
MAGSSGTMVDPQFLFESVLSVRDVLSVGILQSSPCVLAVSRICLSIVPSLVMDNYATKDPVFVS